MKTIIEFDNDNPEDIKGLKRVLKANDMAIVLFEIVYNIRGLLENKIPDEANIEVTLDYVFDKIDDLLDDANIHVDDLIN